ncbi:hypothetical protein PFISCL1PPCAC_22529, partial [Pristionchus fissidentatus]
VSLFRAMRLFFLILSTLFIVSDARVTFTYSEVIQANDLVGNTAGFKCTNGCRVYVDLKFSTMKITQNGVVITDFAEIIGKDSFTPKGFDLPAGNNYKVENQANQKPPPFVLYAVDNKAPNFKTPVFDPQGTVGINSGNWKNRYFTILSSFDAMWYYGFNGTFPAGYPKIYTTGFDAVLDDRCHPVYEARSQYQAEQSWPMIYAPIITVDFGYEGTHTAIANQKSGAIDPLKNGAASTVYMSPGHVGCSFAQNAYYSPVNEIEDVFMLQADSLDISAVYSNIEIAETVHFSVNNVKMDMVGSSSISQHYGPSHFNVNLAWTRLTPTSSFSLQLDFGTKPDPPQTTRAPSNDLSTTSHARRPLAFGLSATVIMLAMFG